jgi:hypothetical protein
MPLPQPQSHLAASSMLPERLLPRLPSQFPSPWAGQSTACADKTFARGRGLWGERFELGLCVVEGCFGVRWAGLIFRLGLGLDEDPLRDGVRDKRGDGVCFCWVSLVGG